MPSLHPTTRPTKHRNWNAAEDADTLRFALRMMLDFHGPAAVINYAKDHGIRCETCCSCGWMPHLDGECLLCDQPVPAAS